MIFIIKYFIINYLKKKVMNVIQNIEKKVFWILTYFNAFKDLIFNYIIKYTICNFSIRSYYIILLSINILYITDFAVSVLFCGIRDSTVLE